jgi:hypothetical protein
LPEKITRDALNAEKLFPKKRKIIHYLQPHHPFLSTELGDRLENPDPTGDTEREKAYDMGEKGKLSQEEIRRAYSRNLEIVLEQVDKLKQNLEGKTIVTADHGDLLGEAGLYGHPSGSTARVLRKVPWDVVSEN